MHRDDSAHIDVTTGLGIAPIPRMHNDIPPLGFRVQPPAGGVKSQYLASLLNFPFCMFSAMHCAASNVSTLVSRTRAMVLLAMQPETNTRCSLASSIAE
jgi:hypothetical protein